MSHTPHHKYFIEKHSLNVATTIINEPIKLGAVGAVISASGKFFVFAGGSVREVPPLTGVLVRLSLAVFMLLPIFWYYGYNLPNTFQS